MQFTFAGAVLATILSLSSFSVAAREYCAMPYLYATNIRPACEQYGVAGMSGLYSASRFINGMLHAAHKLPKAARR